MIIIGEYQLAEVWLVSFCLKATRQAENEPLIIERYSNNIQRERIGCRNWLSLWSCLGWYGYDFNLN